MMFFLALNGLSITVILCTLHYGSTSTEDNLTLALLANYGANVRPVCPGNEVVNVTVDMAIRQLITLDEPSQTVRFNVWMRLGWRDCKLTWDPKEFNGIKSIVLPINLIWKPDITLYPSISDEFFGIDNYRPRIFNDGYVSYNFPSKLEALCPLKVSKFPFDSQTCSFMFGSWSYHGFEIDVSSKNNMADLTSVKPNVEWIIKEAPAERHEIYYGCCKEPYPDVTFYIHITRKPDYYVTNIIIPSVLITLVACLGFCLPAEAGEKIGLELTVMLAMSVFQLLIADQLPPSADDIPWISKFFNFTLVLSGLASCWQVIVLNIHHRGERPMPRVVKYYIIKYLSMLTCVSLSRVDTYKQNHCAKQDLNQNRRSKEDESGHTVPYQETDDSGLWIQLALMIDRIGLVVITLTLSIGCAYILLGIKTP